MNDRTLLSIQIGQPTNEDAPDGRPFRTSLYKKSVKGPIWLGAEDLTGNFQANLKYHGGLDKAVCCFASEHYPSFGKFLGRDLPFGAFGENFTLTGMLEDEVCVGDCYEIGEAMIEISQPRQPCINLARRWESKNLPARIVQSGRSGWYARVIREGNVETGQTLALAERPFAKWTITRLNNLMYSQNPDRTELEGAIILPQLFAGWRKEFGNMLQALNATH